MGSITQTVFTWHNANLDGLTHVPQLNISNEVGDANAAADKAIGWITSRNHPTGAEAVMMKEITTAFGLSRLYDWPQWVSDKLDPAGSFLASGITYFNTFWARFVSQGVIPKYVILDEESPQTTFRWRNQFDNNAGSTAINSASWSGGVVTLDLGIGHGLTTGDDAIVVDGMTPNGYNGVHNITAADSGAGTLQYSLTDDPGAATVTGTAYYGKSTAVPQMYQMAVDDFASSLPQIRIRDQLVAANFGSSSVDGTAADNWNPYAFFAYALQLRRVVIDTFANQFGHKPIACNYNQCRFAWSNADADNVGAETRTERGSQRGSCDLFGASSPVLYFDDTSASNVLTGATKADRVFQNIILYVNKARSILKTPSRLMPWVSFNNMDSGIGWAVTTKTIEALHALGVNEWLLFNNNASLAENKYAQWLFHTRLAQIEQSRPNIPLFDLDETRIVVGDVVIDKDELMDDLS